MAAPLVLWTLSFVSSSSSPFQGDPFHGRPSSALDLIFCFFFFFPLRGDPFHGRPSQFLSLDAAF